MLCFNIGSPDRMIAAACVSGGDAFFHCQRSVDDDETEGRDKLKPIISRTGAVVKKKQHVFMNC
jgi:hypothetical protein